MKEYNRDSRTATHSILKRYTGVNENQPLGYLPRSRRVLPLFVRLQTESVTSFPSRLHSEVTPRVKAKPTPEPEFSLAATREDFRQRMIDQIRRYLSMDEDRMTPEWRKFGERNWAVITPYMPLRKVLLASQAS